MNLESLCEPLPGDSPVGVDCESDIQSQNFPLMTDYLVERAIQKGRERAVEQTDLEEGEARNAASVRDEGKRRLLSLEGILKDALKLSTVNVEQVSKLLREKTCSLLAQRGKDLRLVPPLAAACALSDGLAGYASALKLAAALLETYPKLLFPLPDEDEPEDLWKRANAIADLLSADGIHALLGPVVVIDAKQAGRLTLAELVGGLHNDIPAVETSRADLDMALSKLGAERTGEVFGLLRDIESSIDRIVQAFAPGVLGTLRLAETFKRAIARIALFDGGGAVTEIPARADAVSNVAAVPGGAKSNGELRSREDARRAIQDVIRFIEKLEPGHPAPLLLKRADRLLGMGFFEIIKDMAPNALSDIERIVGAEMPQ